VHDFTGRREIDTGNLFWVPINNLGIWSASPCVEGDGTFAKHVHGSSGRREGDMTNAMKYELKCKWELGTNLYSLVYI